MHFAKNEILFIENEDCNKIGIVYDGLIKIASFLDNGKEIVYNTIKKGGMFGSNLIFSSDTKYRGDVISITESTVCLLNKNELIELLQSNKEFLELFLKYQADFSKDLNFKIKLLTFNNANDRLLYLLELNNGFIQFKTISKLAESLFLTREALSRSVSKLEKEKQIIRSNRSITKI